MRRLVAALHVGQQIRAAGQQHRLARRVGESAHELAALAASDEAGVERLLDALGEPPAIVVPELEDDVHDVDGLAQVRTHLFGG